MWILINQRLLYNAALQERIGAWRMNGISIGLNDQTKSMTRTRRDDAAYGGVAYDVPKPSRAGSGIAGTLAA